MAKENANRVDFNVFDFICASTRFAEQIKVMEGFFKDRLAELAPVDRNILSIIAKHQPIAEFNLRSHTRKISKFSRSEAVITLAKKNIISVVGNKLTVHPAFMEVL